MTPLVEINHLVKTYPGFQLKNVGFSIPGGSIVGFIGENGSGKTTTIKLMLNLIHREQGDIHILGQDIDDAEVGIKEEIGVVLDDSFFYEGLTPQQIGRVLGKVYKNWDDALFASYLTKFQLPKKKSVKEYSKGMRMKLAIAAAMAHHPKLLILDEPTSGLDPVVRNEILDLFLDFIQDEEHAILISTHITSDLERIADYIVFIHHGKILLNQSKDELLEYYGMLRCGLQDVDKIDQEDIAGVRKSGFGYELLVKEKSRMIKKYPQFVIDKVDLEEIMVFLLKGEK